MMRRMTIPGLGLALFSAPLFAQSAPKPDTTRETRTSTSISTGARPSKSGGKTSTRSYKVVTKDGKVIEETGDPSVLGGLGGASGLPDLDALMRRAREGLGESKKSAGSTDSSASSSSSSSSTSRRVVVKNGKTVVDEEFVDGEKIRPGGRKGKDRGDGLEGARGRFPELDRLLRDLDRKARSRGGSSGKGTPSTGGRATHLPPPATRPKAPRPMKKPSGRPAGRTSKKGGALRLG